MDIELSAILEKVKNMFMRYGIKSVTMDDVARELGMSKKTLYQYVDNKEDLVEKVLMHIHSMYHSNSADFCEFGKLNAIEVLMKVDVMVSKIIKDHNPSMQYDLKKYYPDIAKRFIDMRNKEIFDAIIQNTDQGIKDGHYRKNIDKVLIAKLYISRMNTIDDDNIFSLDEIKAPNFFRTIMELHIRGIATPKGNEILEKELEKYNN